MTLPVSGPISMSQVNTELLITPSTTLITMNDSGVRFLTGTSSGTTDSMQQLLGKSYVIAANSGILTSGSYYTLPQTSGTTIKIIAIAGGGGGGGGSFRNAANAGYNVGAGGGGAGGNVYLSSVTVTPGQTIYFSIGGGGAGGAPGYGVYSPTPQPGSIGTQTTVTVSGSVVAQANAGGGGAQSPTATAGSAGSAGTGSQYLSVSAANDGYSNNQFVGQGGVGAIGYSINTTVGASISSILTYGSAGATYYAGGPASTASTVYGAGGGGGGTCQADQQSYQNAYPAAGTVGAVFIWWGY